MFIKKNKGKFQKKMWFLKTLRADDQKIKLT